MSTCVAPPNWPAPPPGWSPPPGWQPDPGWGPAPEGWQFIPQQATPEQRPLSGYGISPAYAPPPTGYGASPSGEQDGREPVDNTLAWLLVFAPILIVLIDVALLASGTVEAYTYSFWIAIGLNTALAVTDASLLNKRGYKVNTFLALFLIPVYLVQRSRVTKQTYAMPAVWIALFIVSIAGSSLVERSMGVLEMDMQYVETSIKDDVDASF